MPSRRAIWRVRSSKAGASALDTPNLPSSGMRLCVLGQASRRNRSRSCAPPVSCTILSSSSSESKAKLRTPKSR